MGDFKATAKMDSKGNLTVEIPEIDIILRVTPSYYKKHAKDGVR